MYQYFLPAACITDSNWSHFLFLINMPNRHYATIVNVAVLILVIIYIHSSVKFIAPLIVFNLISLHLFTVKISKDSFYNFLSDIFLCSKLSQATDNVNAK